MKKELFKLSDESNTKYKQPRAGTKIYKKNAIPGIRPLQNHRRQPTNKKRYLNFSIENFCHRK